MLSYCICCAVPGIPQPPKDFEIETRKAAGNKRYKPPPEPKKRPDQQAFNSGNFHTMNASVKFQARGLFYGKRASLAKQTHVKGFIVSTSPELHHFTTIMFPWSEACSM
eukprot:GHVQ01003074.1.p1 GENE.GHVQ01003074.1~~GHVQ01003074.1.p1  ORF type:complete len:109 (-),score=11.37 GHVQ01003074.1:669-995(-)